MDRNTNPKEELIEISPDQTEDGDHFAVLQNRNGTHSVLIIQTEDLEKPELEECRMDDGTYRRDMLEDVQFESADRPVSDIETYLIPKTMPETQPKTLHLGEENSPRNDKLRRIAHLDDRYNAVWTPAGDIIDDLLDDRLAELNGGDSSGSA